MNEYKTKKKRSNENYQRKYIIKFCTNTDKKSKGENLKCKKLKKLQRKKMKKRKYKNYSALK